MSSEYIISQAFENAVLDFVNDVSAAEVKCALQFACLPDDEWAQARARLRSWLEREDRKSLCWQQILNLAEHQRSRCP